MVAMRDFSRVETLHEPLPPPARPPLGERVTFRRVRRFGSWIRCLPDDGKGVSP